MNYFNNCFQLLTKNYKNQSLASLVYLIQLYQRNLNNKKESLKYKKEHYKKKTFINLRI